MKGRVAIARGAWAERVAERHLVARGWRIVDRNWRCRAGEIDRVAVRGRVLAFVEVKSLRDGAWEAAEAVGFRKRARIERAARSWLLSHAVLAGERDPRFDVVTVTGHRVAHLENAFEASS